MEYSLLHKDNAAKVANLSVRAKKSCISWYNRLLRYFVIYHKDKTYA